jgi:hypothetical protein
LLGAIEAMDFIDKQDGTRAPRGNFLFRPLERFSQFLDAAGDCVDLPKLTARFDGQEMRQGRFASSGRSIENNRLNSSGSNQTRQKLARRSESVFGRIRAAKGRDFSRLAFSAWVNKSMTRSKSEATRSVRFDYCNASCLSVAL